MAKPGTGTKALVTVASGGAIYFAGGAIGKAAKIPAGWKRGAIGAVVTVVVAGVASTLKATKALATNIGIGGALGAVALMFEPQLKAFMAERRAQAPAQYDEFAVSAPMPPAVAPPAPAPVVIQQPAPMREPTVIEQLSPIFGSAFSMFGDIFGGSTGGAGMTYSAPSGAGARLGIYELTRN